MSVVNSGNHYVVIDGDLWEPSTSGPTLDFDCIPNRMLRPISKPPWRYILGDSFIFGSFLSTSSHPCWDPNFSPPCGQWAVPYPYAHEESGPNLKSCT